MKRCVTLLASILLLMQVGASWCQNTDYSHMSNPELERAFLMKCLSSGEGYSNDELFQQVYMGALENWAAKPVNFAAATSVPTVESTGVAIFDSAGQLCTVNSAGTVAQLGSSSNTVTVGAGGSIQSAINQVVRQSGWVITAFPVYNLQITVVSTPANHSTIIVAGAPYHFYYSNGATSAGDILIPGSPSTSTIASEIVTALNYDSAGIASASGNVVTVSINTIDTTLGDNWLGLSTVTGALVATGNTITSNIWSNPNPLPMTVFVPQGLYAGSDSVAAGQLDIVGLGPVIINGTITTNPVMGSTVSLMGNIQVINPASPGACATDSGVTFYNPSNPVPVVVMSNDAFASYVNQDTTGYLLSLPGVSANDSSGSYVYDSTAEVSPYDYAWQRGIPLAQLPQAADITFDSQAVDGGQASFGQMTIPECRSAFWDRGSEFVSLGGNIVNVQSQPVCYLGLVTSGAGVITSAGNISPITGGWAVGNHVYVWGGGNNAILSVASITSANGLPNQIATVTVVSGGTGYSTSSQGAVAGTTPTGVYTGPSNQWQNGTPYNTLVSITASGGKITGTPTVVWQTLTHVNGEYLYLWNTGNGSSLKSSVSSSLITSLSVNNASSGSGYTTGVYPASVGSGAFFNLTPGATTITSTYPGSIDLNAGVVCGIGYDVGETLTVLGGSTDAILTVTSAGQWGQILGYSVTSAGSGYTAYAPDLMCTTLGNYSSQSAAYSGETIGVQQFYDALASGDILTSSGQPIPLGITCTGMVVPGGEDGSAGNWGHGWTDGDDVTNFMQAGQPNVYDVSSAASPIAVAGWVPDALSCYSWILAPGDCHIRNNGPYIPRFGTMQDLSELDTGSNFNGQPPLQPIILVTSASPVSNYANEINLLSGWQQAGLIRCMSPTTFFNPSQWNAPNGIPQLVDNLTQTQISGNTNIWFDSSSIGYLSDTGGNPAQCLVLTANEYLEQGVMIFPLANCCPGRVHELDFDVLGNNVEAFLQYEYTDSSGSSAYVATCLNDDLTVAQTGATNTNTCGGQLDTQLLFGSGTGPGWRHYKIPVGIPSWAESTELILGRLCYPGESDYTSSLNVTKIANLSWRLD